MFGPGRFLEATPCRKCLCSVAQHLRPLCAQNVSSLIDHVYDRNNKLGLAADGACSFALSPNSTNAHEETIPQKSSCPRRETRSQLELGWRRRSLTGLEQLQQAEEEAQHWARGWRPFPFNQRTHRGNFHLPCDDGQTPGASCFTARRCWGLLVPLTPTPTPSFTYSLDRHLPRSEEGPHHLKRLLFIHV